MIRHVLPIFLASLVGLATAACGDDDGDGPATVIDFESATLTDGQLTGETTAPALELDGVRFTSSWNAEFSVYGGFSVSSQTDTTTPGFMNPLSAFPGEGAFGSAQFGVWNPPFGSEDPAITFPEDVQPAGVQVANTTYAALSMQMGDAFAKQHTADDMDFFEVIFTGLDADGDETGTARHFLSDFRSGTEPGIQEDWQRVDLTALGTVRSIAITFESSDVGSFGINTPLYVALDDLAFR